MRRHIASITDVAERNMCCGCGVCAFAQPEDITMVDDLDTGRRPIVTDGADTSAALACCPGVELDRPDPPPGADESLRDDWGPVLEVWEGHATDADARLAGSSGGVATALARFGVEEAAMSGALQIRQRHDVPILNETVFATTGTEVLESVASRYAPASPCDGLHHATEPDARVVFVGKPCDVAGVARARERRPDLDAGIAVTVAIFCAGAPSTNGTLAMLAEMGVSDWRDVEYIRYRGQGWPGTAAARLRGEPGERTMSYAESWGGVLQKHRPWRCRTCLDHTGEFADLAVGDPWYREIGPDEAGSSLIVVRSERGRDFLARAREAGYLDISRVSNEVLPQSQPNLLGARGAVWGRILAMRLLGLPAPRFRNMASGRLWWRQLSHREKFRSIAGTMRRIVRRGLYRRRPVKAWAEQGTTSPANTRSVTASRTSVSESSRQS